MADLKDEYSAELVVRLADELHRARPQFAANRFAEAASAGLAPLALMDRVRHIAAALAQEMPGDFAATADVLDRAAGSPTFTGWMVLPCSTYVASAGIEHPNLALPVLARLTPRWSSEFALRPFIERHPETTFAYLDKWVRDPDEHVRRLVSEGTRPRLPWASRLPGLQADPAPVVPLLDQLFDDPSSYVRKSVANHLNDIAKDHPDLALELAHRWSNSGEEQSAQVVRHGMRTLVKEGDPAALALLGFGDATALELDKLTVTPARVPIGGEVVIEFTLSTSEAAVRTAIDYRVHHFGARGSRRPKVFKLTTRTVEPGNPVAISRRHRFRSVSVRTIYPGPHRIEIQVNGRILGEVEVEVEAAEQP